MAKQGIPVVLVENGTPAILGNKGMPITIVGGHGGAGEVVDQQVVPVTNSAGGDAHDANAAVSNGQLTGLELQSATAAFVDDGDMVFVAGADGSLSFGSFPAVVSTGALQQIRLSAGRTVITNQAGAITVNDADGTQVNATATIASNGALSFVGVPDTAALVTGGMSMKMANFGGAGPVDGTVQITGGFINWVSLANQTDAIISNTFSTSISGIAVSPSDDFASVNVSSGALQSVAVSLAPTKTVVTDAQALQVPVTGTYTNTATVSVANGVITGIALS